MQVMDLFNDDGHGSSIIHGAVVMPPPPPPPPPPLVDLHSSSRSNRSSSKATSRHPGLCTEGLGSESSESSGDLDLANVPDDTDKEAGVDAGQGLQYCKRQYFDNHDEEMMPMPARTRGRRVFPPPISVIGAAGKPWQYLRAHRGGGRLVLQEVRIPSRELLQACREDGRLKLHFAHPEERQQLADYQCHEQDTKN